MHTPTRKALLLAIAFAAAAAGCSNKSKTSPGQSQESAGAAELRSAPPSVDSIAAPPPADIGSRSGLCGQFNGGAACTPTELRFVNKSFECYSCLVNASCLNSVAFGDKNHECEDLKGNATGGAKAGTANSALCLATIDCILASHCASSDVASCYCGPLAGSTCAMAATPGQGACAQAEVEGSNHLITDPASSVSPALGDLGLPAGKADAIFACAKLNNCERACSR